jgi:hypothetical protein
MLAANCKLSYGGRLQSFQKLTGLDTGSLFLPFLKNYSDNFFFNVFYVYLK